MLPNLSALNKANVVGAPGKKPVPLPMGVFERVPPDMMQQIVMWVTTPSADCRTIFNLCAASRDLNAWCHSNEDFWRWACRRYDWDRDDRLWTTFDSLGATQHEWPWKRQYTEWCKRQHTNKTLREAVEVTREWSSGRRGRFTTRDDHEFYGEIECWDTSQVTSMELLFAEEDCFNHDITRWDTARVTNMAGMFYQAVDFNQPIGGWNVSSVINMDCMFNFALSFDQDISGWDTSNVAIFDEMFDGAERFNQDLSKWEVGNSVVARGVFHGAESMLETHKPEFDPIPTCWVDLDAFYLGDTGCDSDEEADPDENDPYFNEHYVHFNSERFTNDNEDRPMRY